MNESPNLIILVSLFSIGLALVIGFIWGFRKGAADQQQEASRRATRIARRRVELAFED